MYYYGRLSGFCKGTAHIIFRIKGLQAYLEVPIIMPYAVDDLYNVVPGLFINLLIVEHSLTDVVTFQNNYFTAVQFQHLFRFFYLILI